MTSVWKDVVRDKAELSEQELKAMRERLLLEVPPLPDPTDYTPTCEDGGRATFIGVFLGGRAIAFYYACPVSESGEAEVHSITFMTS